MTPPARLATTLTSLSLLMPRSLAQEGADAGEGAPAEEAVPSTVLSPPQDLTEAAGLLASWIEQGKTWVVEEGPGMLVKIVTFLIILFVFKVLSGVAASVVRKALSASQLKISNLLQDFAINTTRKLVWFAGLIIALGTIGIETGPLLAGLGVLGFVVGFALQDTMGNFASGVMILLYRPYDVGDVITAAGITGKVSEMSLVSTTLTSPDNQAHIVPNGSIWGGTITNITANDTRRVDMTMGIGYGDDIDKAAKVLMDIVSSHELVLKDPAPVIELSNLGDSSVDFVVRPWCKTGDYWRVYWDLTKSLKQGFDEHDIGIPYPTQDLYLKTDGPVEVKQG